MKHQLYLKCQYCHTYFPYNGGKRSYDDYLKEKFPCYNSGKRKKTTPEAFATLAQSIRNLGYELIRVMKGQV